MVSASSLPPLAEWLHNGLFYGLGLPLYTQRGKRAVNPIDHVPVAVVGESGAGGPHRKLITPKTPS
jgi:hypothetical protein